MRFKSVVYEWLFKTPSFRGRYLVFPSQFCSAQFTFLQSVLHKNRKTIISPIIICNSISVFLTNVWKVTPRSDEENPRNPTKFDVLGKLVWQFFHFRPISNIVAKGVTLICHAFSFYVYLLSSILQSNQVKRTPQECINEFIIQKLNPLLVVDFRLISAFLYV